MSEPACSFCGKKQSEVMVLIAGARAFICDECGMLAVQMISVENIEWRDRLSRTLALLPKQ
jgi:ATP-dependent Clp protease ATP-binding subunit ClpX